MLTVMASFAPVDFFTRLLGNTPFEIAINSALLVVIGYFAYRWILEPVYDALRGMVNFWKLRKSKAAYLEITPPQQSDKSPIATEQLVTILRRLIGKYGTMSLEMVATHKEGIRYLIRTNPDDVATLQRQLAAYLPDARFRVLNDDAELPGATADGMYCRVHEVKLSRHYAYPLQGQDDLSQSDPVAFIAGSMTKLEPGEAVAMQMVLAPHSSYWTNKLHSKILSKGHAIIDHRFKYFLRRFWLVWVVAAFIGYYSNDIKLTLSWALILLFAAWIIPKFRGEDEPELTPAVQELYATILNKLGQPLFRTDIRVLLVADSGERLSELSHGITSSLAPLSSTFQELYVPRIYPDWLGQKIGMFKVQHRVPSFLVMDSNILSASELASIYHFPYGTVTTEGMVRSHSRTLAAPLGIKSGEFDVVLGRNHHHGTSTDIGLTAAERERHVYIIGGTGNGTTTMLQYAIMQDIQNGKGMAVIDPHGDMAETLLCYVPKDRINDVIYFNPDDLAHPIALNLLELRPGLSDDDLLREKDLVTEAVVSVFRKIFSEDDSGGHRIEYVLRNTIQTALTTENPTLFTIFDLLNDPAYRKTVLSKLEDKDLKNFWKNELGKAGGFQQVKMVAGITAKIGRFLFSASAKRILEQPKSSIDFDDILNGKILICNFSKGLLGEDTSQLFGITVLAKLQITALRRARVKQVERKPFHLYVDEFQNFATPTFVQMLSEARKYKLYLTMAEQSTSQQDELQTVNIILANVGTVICFRTGNPADEKLVLPLFKPHINEGEIANLPSYNFYMRIAAVKSQEPFSGETVLLEDGGDEKMAEKVTTASRNNYASKRAAKVTPKKTKASQEQDDQKEPDNEAELLPAAD